MGQEILYCSKCQTRLLGADFEKGLAFRIANQTVCRTCAQTLVDTLPPVRATPHPQTASIPVRPRTTVRHAAAEKGAAKSRLPLLFAGAGTLAILSLLVWALKGSNPREEVDVPPPRPPSPPPKPAVPTPPPAPPDREESARAALRKARDYAAANPADFAGQTNLFRKALWEADKTPLQEEVRKELEAVQAREKAAAALEGPGPAAAGDALRRRAWKEVKKIRAESARRGDTGRLEAVDRAIAEASATIGLVAWWPLDEETGTSAADLSGRGHTGTVRGKADWRPAEGRSGGALAFDGSTTCVVVASRRDLNITGAVTLAAWCRPANLDTNRRILQKGKGDNQYRITVDQVHPGSDVRKFRFDLKNAGPLDVPLPTARPWVHVAATYDRATMKVFFNGVLAGERAATAAIATTNDPLVIGTKFDGAPPGDYFLGLLDEVQVYDRALTPEDVKALSLPPD